MPGLPCCTDTTAFALYGDYPNQDTGPTAPVVLTWGHSEDHRPDLHQIMAGLTVDDAGCVLGGAMLSGNTSDRAGHPEWLDQLDKDFPDDFWKDSFDIADSALIAEPALLKIRALGMHWLGRLPATFGLGDRLKDQAWAAEEPWEPLGTLAAQSKSATATYQAQTFNTTLYDLPARAFVYHSSALDKKKEHTLQREVAREAQVLEKTAKKLAKQVFHCAEDATAAGETLVRTAKIWWHTVTPTIGTHGVPVRTRGRQKAGAEPETVTQYTVQWHWTAPTPEHLQAERAMVRQAMVEQPPLELPDHRKIARPSETVILDALRTLWVERKEEESMVWYQWTHVKPHVWRILEMLQIPIQHRFQWDSTG